MLFPFENWFLFSLTFGVTHSKICIYGKGQTSENDIIDDELRRIYVPAGKLGQR